MGQGQAPHVPTEETRKTVEAMSSYGIPQADICNVIGIDPKTLRKYYRYELDTAEAKANARVASMLYNNCMKGKEASIFFWLKTRAKYKETSKVEQQTLDKDGNPTDPGENLLTWLAANAHNGLPNKQGDE